MNLEQFLNEQFLDSDIRRELAIPDEYKLKGYIYILSNQSMPNVYKVGMTERRVEERVRELSKMTAIPTPFNIEACFYSNDPYKDEQEIHQLLAQYRISDRKEFFKCELKEIIDAIYEILPLERNGELANLLACYDVIGLGHGVDMDLDEILEDLPVRDQLYSLGNDVQIKHFLVKVGARYLKKLLTKHRTSLVLMPDNSIELVRSTEEQYRSGEE